MRIVQKYGGSSVATAERIQLVVSRIIATRHAGHEVIVVVSAMGDTTDELVALAKQLAAEPDPRELDVLMSTGETQAAALVAIALKEQSIPAVSLTASQAGIRTTDRHRRALITAVHPERVIRELDAGKVCIITGFQGITENGDITTIGRGGSDSSAVAIAVALKADRCEFYKDVEGILTADPRIVPQAQKLDVISHEEILELTTLGAQVLHPRAIELGQVYQMPLVVLPTFSAGSGTIIRTLTEEERAMEQFNRVSGVVCERNVAKVTIVGVPDRPGVAYQIFKPLAEAGINVDIIVQNVSREGITDVSFTLSAEDLPAAQRLLESVRRALGAAMLDAATGFGKISIVGVGMQTHPGYAATMFGALRDAGINIQMITTSDIRITCLIDDQHVDMAVRALHEVFIEQVTTAASV